ncbi:MAG: DUF465 domain-containing protein [Nitrospirota bacterium]
MNVEVKEEAVLDQLRKADPEFQRWEQEHRKLDDELMNFETHVYLTPEEEIERKRMQKLKLAAKDRMMEMVRRYKTGQA